MFIPRLRHHDRQTFMFTLGVSKSTKSAGQKSLKWDVNRHLACHITSLWRKKKTRSGAAKSQKESFLILVSAIKNSNSMICISFRSCKKDSFELEFCPNALWSKCEVYDHVVGKYFECKQWQLVSSLLSRVLTQPNNINKHDQWLRDSKGDLSNQIQKGGKKKNNLHRTVSELSITSKWHLDSDKWKCGLKNRPGADM